MGEVADDLVARARSAYMRGRDDDYVAALKQAHQTYLDARCVPEAIRCAFWIGHSFLFHGQASRANGWWAIGERLLEEHELDCVERGYLLIPTWLREMGAGNWAAALDATREGARVAERFGDADLLWLARDDQAGALLRLGQVAEGLSLVDELLVTVSSGVLSPVVSGIVYCNTIAFCRETFQQQHAAEWTDALSAWCEGQPGMVAHNGLCLVHRAEVAQLRGHWSSALEEAQLAVERFTAGALNQIASGKAYYRQAEIHRLRGRLSDAERCYQEADRNGCHPQPGLALVWLAQGQTDAAASAIRRAVTETAAPLQRAVLLPAYVQIMVAAGDVEAAEAAARELDEIARRQASDSLAAMATQAGAHVCGALGDARACLVSAREAWQRWHELGSPYDAACARVLVAQACRALDDMASADLELTAAREVFERLGAESDVRHVDALREASDQSGLSARELEVLRLVASGSSNRQIATTLVISERTVARHVQNIFAKLGVASRTQASAFAHEHHLV